MHLCVYINIIKNINLCVILVGKHSRTRILTGDWIEMIQSVLLVIKARRPDCLPVTCPSFWGKVSLNSGSIVTVSPHPPWSRRKCQYWDFLGMSLSAVRPQYLTKTLIINVSFGLMYEQKGELYIFKKWGFMERNLTGWSDH